jgi:hypothetical protein
MLRIVGGAVVFSILLAIQAKIQQAAILDSGTAPGMTLFCSPTIFRKCPQSTPINSKRFRDGRDKSAYMGAGS